MALKKETTPNHFVATHLGATVTATEPYRISIIWALCLWDFVKGDREFAELNKRGLGLDGISALTGISESKAKALLHRMALEQPPVVEKVHGRRDLGERTSWRLVAPLMRWEEAKRLLAVRLPQVRTLRGQLPLLDATIGLPSGQMVQRHPATTNQASSADKAGSPPLSSRTNIKDPRPSTETQKTDQPADAGAGSLMKPGRELRTYFKQRYFDRHGKQMSKVRFNWISSTEDSLVEEHGLVEMKARVRHYMADPFRTTHSYQNFLKSPDDWTKPRVKIGQPQKDEEPKRGRSAAADLAHLWGLEVKDEAD